MGAGGAKPLDAPDDAVEVPKFTPMDSLTRDAARRIIQSGHSADMAAILEWLEREMAEAVAFTGPEVLEEVDLVSECILPVMNQMGRTLPRWVEPAVPEYSDLRGRYDHFGIRLGDSRRVLVYGGTDQEMNPDPSVNVLEVGSWEWWKPTVKGAAPSVTQGQAVAFCRNFLLVFGGTEKKDGSRSNGLWTLNVSTG
eukprot:TRINITY_DN8062_c0_g1_i1.p3 TRINITY_DN8062_c0_g1~~TRINITY_DN8062_c0_g1_i1.p3  ORF type:complete len:196 (-),score=40.70 TRINITY_DN8062_c0_g1_i1:1007-1594(-)